MDIEYYIKLIQSLAGDLKKARHFQIEISKKVVLADTVPIIRAIAGIDVSYKNNKAFVAAVTVDLKTGSIIEEHYIASTVRCNYIPTFLFLRELPLLLEIFRKISSVDCFFIDAHGLAHPYYAGLALMFGVITDRCTVGIAKSPLRGIQLQATNAGEKYKQMFINNRLVGIAVKPSPNHRTIYVSPGHKITITTALELAEKMLRKDKRLPLPLHYAHILSERFKHHSVGQLFENTLS